MGKFRHRLFYQVTHFLLIPIYFVRGFRWKKYKPGSDSYIVLSNHTSNSDSFYAGFCFNRQMYFVSGENVLRVPVLGKFLKWSVNPVFRKKGASGKDAASEIINRISQGDRICMTVEGNKSFNGATTTISPNTAKLLKDCKTTVITVRIHGGYMCQPRWSDTKRRGRVWSEVIHEYSVEEVASLSDDELNKRILDDIYVNAYEDQKKYMYTYRGKALAQGIERILYMCPKCKGFSTIHSNGNGATCTNCNLHLDVDKYGFLHSSGTDFTTVYDWNNWQQSELIKYLEKAKSSDSKVFETTPSYELFCLSGSTSTVSVGKSCFDIYNNRIELADHTFYYKDIMHFSLSMSSKALFSTTDGQYWQIKTSGFDSLVKFQVAIQFFQNKPILLR